jgi:DNA-binding XRE family transcriptional regulator
MFTANKQTALLAHRRRNGLSQQDVADRIGVDRVQVSRWEIGKHVPMPGIALSFADVFNCTVADLFNRDGHVWVEAETEEVTA